MQNDKVPDWKAILERRASLRMTTLSPAFFKWKESKNSQGWGWITDIGVSGLQLMSYFALNFGEDLVITFSLEKNVTLTDVCGRVVHVNVEYGYYYAGILFTNNSDRDLVRNTLETLLEEAL